MMLVTGAIGHSLVKDAVRVVLHYGRNRAVADTLAVIADVLAQKGSVQVLCNNAGIGLAGRRLAGRPMTGGCPLQ